MQADQTVLSLRPGGGTRGGSRVFGARFDSSAATSSDIPLLRPHGGTGASSFPSLKTGESRFDGHERIRYTRDQLLQLREVSDISDDILKVKIEVEAEFFGADPSWSRVDINLPNQSQTRYSEPDNRDWRNRPAQFPPSADERSWESIRDRDFGGRFDSKDINQYNKQEQPISQFGRAVSSNQGIMRPARPKMQSSDYYSKPKPSKSSTSNEIVTSNPFQSLGDFPPMPTFSQAVQARPVRPLSNPVQFTPITPVKGESSSPKKAYFTKNPIQHITLTNFDKPTYHKTLLDILSRYFPEGCQWYPEDHRKTQHFYELILVDSKSVDITHVPSTTDASFIAYSKVVINKCLKSEEWINPLVQIPFTIDYDPPGYNYADYKFAWFRGFFFRVFEHSWFFNFHFNFSKTSFPIWFAEWWYFFGPTTDILPLDVIQALSLFMQKSTQPISKREIFYFAEFRVPWIFCFNYSFQQYLPKPFSISIIREFRIKWWPEYTTKFCNCQAVQNFLLTGVKPAIFKEKSKTPKKIQEKKKEDSASSSMGKNSPADDFLKSFFDSNPDASKQFYDFVKKKTSSESETGDYEDSAKDDFYDPFGGPCAQDPYEPYDL